MISRRRALFLAILSAAAACSANPDQPHLAKAWTVLSSGDGYPGATGQESYIYTDDPAYSKEGGLRAHLYDYGSYCKKLTYNQFKPTLIEKSFYIKCKAVDCCYKDDDIMKKWDLHKSHLLQPVTINYMGVVNTTALDSQGNNVTITAERWHEKDTLPLGVVHATYDFYITRQGDDVLTHRIEYGADGVNPGIIVYGDFQVQHNLTAFQEVFAIPDECKEAMQCPDEFFADWGLLRPSAHPRAHHIAQPGSSATH